jgi:hypothetical protein
MKDINQSILTEDIKKFARRDFLKKGLMFSGALAGCDIVSLVSGGKMFRGLLDGLTAVNAEAGVTPSFEYEAQGKKFRHRYVFGTEMYTQSEIPRPEKGIPYFDAVFGTKITRISDRRTDRLSPLMNNYGALMHPAYPKHNYDNADGSSLLFMGSLGSGQVIYDARSLKVIKHLDTQAVSWNQPIEPRWDAHDPDLLYYVHSPATALSRYNVKTDKFKVLHDFNDDFPGSTSITMAEEGDCSYDSRYFAYAVLAPRKGDNWTGVAVFCYDRVENRVVGRKTLPIPRFEGQGAGNWLGMSPSGKYVLLGTAPMLVFDREFKKQPVRLTHGGGWHCDVGLDDEGREVILYIGGHTYSPHGQSNGCYAMCDLETGTETVLTSKIGGPDMHFDCSSIFTPGWGVVSHYHPAPPKQSHWTEYSIHLVELTRRKNPPPRIWRICHTHTNQVGYMDCPFATFDRFGTKIFFGSNWGTPLERCGDIDAFQIELPLNWYETLMGAEKAGKLRKIAEGMARKKW